MNILRKIGIGIGITTGWDASVSVSARFSGTISYFYYVPRIVHANISMYMTGRTTDALYTVDLTSGVATRIGTATNFGLGSDPNITAIEQVGDNLIGVATATLYRFDKNTSGDFTGAATAIGGYRDSSNIAITGVRGITYSPTHQNVFLLSQSGGIYRLDDNSDLDNDATNITFPDANHASWRGGFISGRVGIFIDGSGHMYEVRRDGQISQLSFSTTALINHVNWDVSFASINMQYVYSAVSDASQYGIAAQYNGQKALTMPHANSQVREVAFDRVNNRLYCTLRGGVDATHEGLFYNDWSNASDTTLTRVGTPTNWGVGETQADGIALFDADDTYSVGDAPQQPSIFTDGIIGEVEYDHRGSLDAWFWTSSSNYVILLGDDYALATQPEFALTPSHTSFMSEVYYFDTSAQDLPSGRTLVPQNNAFDYGLSVYFTGGTEFPLTFTDENSQFTSTNDYQIATDERSWGEGASIGDESYIQYGFTRRTDSTEDDPTDWVRTMPVLSGDDDRVYCFQIRFSNGKAVGSTKIQSNTEFTGSVTLYNSGNIPVINQFSDEYPFASADVISTANTRTTVANATYTQTEVAGTTSRDGRALMQTIGSSGIEWGSYSFPNNNVLMYVVCFDDDRSAQSLSNTYLQFFDPTANSASSNAAIATAVKGLIDAEDLILTVSGTFTSSDGTLANRKREVVLTSSNTEAVGNGFIKITGLTNPLLSASDEGITAQIHLGRTRYNFAEPLAHGWMYGDASGRYSIMAYYDNGMLQHLDSPVRIVPGGQAGGGAGGRSGGWFGDGYWQDGSGGRWSDGNE